MRHIGLDEGVKLETEDFKSLEAVYIHVFKMKDLDQLNHHEESVFLIAEDKEQRGCDKVHTLNIT